MRLHARRFAPRQDQISRIAKPMRDLIGADFRRALSADQTARFLATRADLKRVIGRTTFDRLGRAAALPSEQRDLSPLDWAKATARFLKRYLTTRQRVKKAALVKAYVPILELGILGFLNRTYSLGHNDASRILDEEYLPVFEQAWSVLAHRIWLSSFWFLRKWPVRVRMMVVRIFSQQAQPGTTVR
jgi:hypothetical protein